MKTLGQQKRLATEVNNNTQSEDSDNLSSDGEFGSFVLRRTSGLLEPNEERPLRIKEKILQKQLEEKIRRLGSQKKLPMKTNIFNYYEELFKSNGIDKECYEMVMVVLTAPATQVSVERFFSAIVIVMEPHKIRMNRSDRQHTGVRFKQTRRLQHCFLVGERSAEG